ncbi:MAG TPA: hypothetical protein VGD70_04265 [Actinophytocola sp.]
MPRSFPLIGRLGPGGRTSRVVVDGGSGCCERTARGDDRGGDAIALCVHEFLGMRILRSAWVNLDRGWAVVLVGAGSATCVAALV